jgi:hypothetical protein
VGLGFHLDEEVASYRHSNSMAGLKQGDAVPGLMEVVPPRAGQQAHLGEHPLVACHWVIVLADCFYSAGH